MLPVGIPKAWDRRSGFVAVSQVSRPCRSGSGAGRGRVATGAAAGVVGVGGLGVRQDRLERTGGRVLELIKHSGETKVPNVEPPAWVWPKR